MMLPLLRLWSVVAAFRLWRTKHEQTLWCSCPGCGFDLVSMPRETCPFTDDGDVVTYQCSCGHTSRWLFSALFPILLHKDSMYQSTQQVHQRVKSCATCTHWKEGEPYYGRMGLCKAPAPSWTMPRREYRREDDDYVDNNETSEGDGCRCEVWLAIPEQ